MTMDRKTLLDGLVRAGKTAEDKLDAHGVRESEDDTPVFDRTRYKRSERALLDFMNEADKEADY